jgi:hypothetical protein
MRHGTRSVRHWNANSLNYYRDAFIWIDQGGDHPLPAFDARPSLRYAAKRTRRATVALRRLITKREQVGLLSLRQGDSRTPLCRFDPTQFYLMRRFKTLLDFFCHAVAQDNMTTHYKILAFFPPAPRIGFPASAAFHKT